MLRNTGHKIMRQKNKSVTKKISNQKGYLKFNVKYWYNERVLHCFSVITHLKVSTYNE